MNLEELIMNDEQIKQFAYNIFHDVGEYVKQNEDKYINWIFDISIESASNLILTLDLNIIIRDTSYSYDLCKYENINVGEMLYEESCTLCPL